MVEFDIRPLLVPPQPDQDKLDQFLDWLAEQEERVPRLRPGYEPARNPEAALGREMTGVRARTAALEGALHQGI